MSDTSSKSPIKPLGDKVVVRPLTEEEMGTTSVSGIIIPDSAKPQERPEQGIVIAVGPGKWNEDGDGRVAMSIKEGDRIVFPRYGYDEITLEKKDYYIVSESSILGIITD